MTNAGKLVIIKSIHSAIWLFFNVVLFYLLYAVLFNKIDKWVWTGLSLIAVEGIVLLIFHCQCPLTVVARRYSTATKDNFDIYLPNWLAKNNKLIYTSFLMVIICILIYRLITR